MASSNKGLSAGSVLPLLLIASINVAGLGMLPIGSVGIVMLGMFAATMLKLLFIPVKRPRRCPGYQ
ncbi:MAG TPA: hypothetical protein VF626_01960, partial [Chthoniobacterales bacterium]